jgi:hypothetical protein
MIGGSLAAGPSGADPLAPLGFASRLAGDVAGRDGFRFPSARQLDSLARCGGMLNRNPPKPFRGIVQECRNSR